ncbi:uncharacterized protein LOC143187478 [Calliopsis andreniformis]|uniref:uncharacterized protein LOC143187478 n=1 Tax=Calliopsis andreniformis TaxID=337506 RepID=UPI003FCCC56E
MEADLKKLIAERGTIKAALTRLSRYFHESAQTVSVKALQKRLEANLWLYNGYNTLQGQIERATEGTDLEASHAADRDTFEETYFNLIAEIESHIERAQGTNTVVNQVAAQVSSPVSTNSPPSVKLPTIQLPSFDGNYSGWIRFRDTFTSLVHESELSDVQKFHYLNSALKGSAARVIQSLGVSDANYHLAWDALKSRYENSAALRKHHVTAILDMPVIQKQSPTALRELVDDTRNHLAALRSLNEPVDSWDSIIVPILSRKLDVVSLKEWEKGATGSEKITFKKFAAFLEERSSYLENIALPTQVAATRAENLAGSSGSRKPFRVTTHVASTASACPSCGSAHPLFRCDKFKGLSIEGKTQIVQTSNRCYNCLQPGHRVQACTRKHCDLCGKKHHILLHRILIPRSNTAITEEPRLSETNTTISCVTNSDRSIVEQSVLSTAVIYIEDRQGQRTQCRALLDSGSQSNFITYKLCKRLGIKFEPTEVQVSGLGGRPNAIRDRVHVKIGSKVNNFRANISCLAIDTITQDMPNIVLNRSTTCIPSHIVLADPDFDKSRSIDVLIGAGLFWQLLCVGQHKAGSELLWQKTQLGWVLGGSISWPINDKIQRCHLVTNQELHSQMERFWKIEEVNVESSLEADECEALFQATVHQTDKGRYVVHIPFNDQIQKLGTSRQQAENRFKALERKLLKQPQLREQYVDFMNEYESLGHMSRISNPVTEEVAASFYLPHHAVTKEDSTTTKLRVVFDGSAKSSTGISLNDTQKIGPTVQSDLTTILLRFRTHRYVLSADVEKMYRQILIEPSQRRFQRILWRKSPNLALETFELNTVTYGTASAPFLATRVLKEIGLRSQSESPAVSRIIINDFYVDDLLTGLDTVSELRETQEKLSNILQRAGLQLRKWSTNCPEFLQHTLESKEKRLSADHESKVLGLHWSSVKDELYFKITPSTRKRITKRSILSEISQIFDPLGLVGPVITRAKLIMQQLWQTKTGWDESLSQELCTQWTEYRKELSHLIELKIPRRALDAANKIELHGFADASERAYGACVYLRSNTGAGKWRTKLLCSKSRVAPLKTVSLPRLELCGALLLANLMNKVRTALRVPIRIERYWCDSTITLAWIRGNSNRWKTFVANRVTQIQALTEPSSWSHVHSEDNPADLISRGSNPRALINNDLWWLGPSWLTAESDHWPQSVEEAVEVPDERKKLVMAATVASNANELFFRYSNYTRLLRITAYCLRFVSNVRGKMGGKLISTKTQNTILTATELQVAQKQLIRLAQREIFNNEIEALRKDHMVPKQSSLLSLSPFLDNSGLIRVGGRLNNASIAYSKKHPIVLPAKHVLTDLIIKNEHIRLLHAGCQHVVASLRERFWPLHCCQNVKRILRSCVRCFRVKPRGIECSMGQLPAARVTPGRPFLTCGVDYAGPFTTKDRTRSRVSVKSYACIFVCFATKATHIELATDLSTDAFMKCLNRFVARRGFCQSIVSDNGTNFVGAKNRFTELDKLIKCERHNSQIAKFLSEHQIQWHFNPPQAPHFGGLWESAVRLTKYHLNRVIGEQRLTYEELYTLLTQIESCLNSRPLSPSSSDPHDVNPLTPGHFLIGTAPCALPDQDVTDIKLNRLNRYQLVQQMFQHFWQRWHKEYLHHLQQRHKWKTSSNQQLRKGSLVVIKEDNLPPLRWSLGRITELHQGKDGISRVVTVRTATGIYKRPTAKICILPMQNHEDSE